MFHNYTDTQKAVSNRFSSTEILSLLIPGIILVWSVVYWGNILWLKYYSLHDYVFDSGLLLNTLYQIFYFHSLSTIISYVGFGPDRIIFSPLSYFHSILLLLYLQMIAVFGSAFIIYYATKTLTKNSIVSSAISVIYLLYFPIDGSIFFDVHAQTYFIPFFLLGFMFQAMNHRRLSIIFFLLAGMTRFPLMAIVVLYPILDFIRNFRYNKQRPNWSEFRKKAHFDMMLFSLSFFILLMEYIIEHDISGIQITSAGYLHVQGTGILSNLGTKVVTIMFFASPFLFLILYVNEFSIILWGLFGFIFFANYQYYYYPDIFTDQYSAVFVAVIFLILIVYLSDRYPRQASGNIEKRSLKHYIMKLKRNDITKVAVAALIFAVLFQPFSPVSTHIGTNFNISNYTDSGPSNAAAVMELSDLIPTNATGVLLQNDLPQVLTHDPNINPNLISYTLGYPFNFTPAFFANSSSIQYIFGYLGTSSFNSVSYGESQYNVIQNALHSGMYGLLGENGTLILLQRSYDESPKIMINPENVNIHDSNFVSIQYPLDKNGSLNRSVNSLFYDDPFFLLPGLYSINFTLSSLNVGSWASFDLQIYGHLFGDDVVNQSVHIGNGSRTFRMEFYSSNVYMQRYLAITNINSQGTVELSSISIQQIN